MKHLSGDFHVAPRLGCREPCSIREAHLRALSSASLQFTPVLELFFCSDAYVDAFWCASLYSDGWSSCLHSGAVGLHVHKSRSAARYKNNVRRRGVLRTLGCVSLMLIISGLPLCLLPVLQARAGSRPSCMFLQWICIQLPCSGLLLCSGTISILS